MKCRESTQGTRIHSPTIPQSGGCACQPESRTRAQRRPLPLGGGRRVSALGAPTSATSCASSAGYPITWSPACSASGASVPKEARSLKSRRKRGCVQGLRRRTNLLQAPHGADELRHRDILERQGSRGHSHKRRSGLHLQAKGRSVLQEPHLPPCTGEQPRAVSYLLEAPYGAGAGELGQWHEFEGQRNHGDGDSRRCHSRSGHRGRRGRLHLQVNRTLSLQRPSVPWRTAPAAFSHLF